MLIAAVTIAAPGHATDLWLSSSARDLPARIAAQCPTCATAGYMPCGSPDVGWGRRFAATALLGEPKRGYLPTFTMTGEELRKLARNTDYDALITTLHDRFATTRLVVIEDGFKDARVLPPPETVDVTFPKPLHDCVHQTTRPWGCCVSDCKDECCEKGLGSPSVTLRWTDDDEVVELHYSHTIGVSWLGRRTPNHRVRYACLVEAKGELRSSEAR
jgi:hypothetical protein